MGKKKKLLTFFWAVFPAISSHVFVCQWIVFGPTNRTNFAWKSGKFEMHTFLKMERPQNHPSDLLKYYCNKENQWSRDTPIVKNIRISPSPRSKLAVLLTRAALASPYPHGRWILPGLMCEEWWLARLFYQKAYKLRVHHLKEGITSNFRRKDLQMLVWGCTNHPAVWPKFDSQVPISDLATWLSQASSVSY